LLFLPVAFAASCTAWPAVAGDGAAPGDAAADERIPEAAADQEPALEAEAELPEGRACASDAECAPPTQYCVAGLCAAIKTLGNACASPSDCASGHCVNGICCSVSTCPMWQACGGAGACAPVPSGTVCVTPNAAADVVLSIFGVIFAPDASIAAAEMARVATPRGRLVFSAWIPGGPIADVMKVCRDAMAAATGAAGVPPFSWHDRDALAGLLSPYGFAVNMREYDLAFTASSPMEFVQADLRDHPLWIACRAVLEPRGAWQSVWQRTLDLLAAANEAPNGFRVSSRYVVAIAERS
jgi:SAM-dependent methyltransferase